MPTSSLRMENDEPLSKNATVPSNSLPSHISQPYGLQMGLDLVKQQEALQIMKYTAPH